MVGPLGGSGTGFLRTLGGQFKAFGNLGPAGLKLLITPALTLAVLLSIDTLNLFAHNEHFHPNEDTLRNFWPPLQGLFEIILVEPDTETDSG